MIHEYIEAAGKLSDVNKIDKLVSLIATGVKVDDAVEDVLKEGVQDVCISTDDVSINEISINVEQTNDEQTNNSQTNDVQNEEESTNEDSTEDNSNENETNNQLQEQELQKDTFKDLLMTQLVNFDANILFPLRIKMNSIKRNINKHQTILNLLLLIIAICLLTYGNYKYSV